MADPLQTFDNALALALILVLREVFGFVWKVINKQSDHNGQSGQKPTDFWLRNFREIMEKVCDDKLKKICDELLEIKDELRNRPRRR